MGKNIIKERKKVKKEKILVVDTCIVVPSKDESGNYTFKKGETIGTGLVVKESHLKEFNEKSHETCERYYVDEKKTKELKK